MKKIYLLLASFLLIQQAFAFSDTTNTSLENKVAQMLIVGFRGTELSKDNSIYNDIKDLKIGGVIYFEYDVPSKSRPRNITSVKQLKRLSHDLQKLAGGSLFISIDQEGGYVNRLKTRYGFGNTISAQQLGQKNNSDTSRFWSAQLANEVQKAGCNLNFAPSVDLNINPLSPIIGKVERSFSADAETATKHARILIEEQNKRGIISVIKHFPGHGSAKADTHLGIADISETWTETELIPYKNLINEGLIDMVMTSHVYNSHLDTLPATLSYPILTTLLREKLGFTGVIVSDDIAMGAISEHYSFDFALEKSINAGVDMLILSNNGSTFDPEITKKTINIVCRLVSEGKIKESTINSAYQRIISLKQKYNLAPKND